MANMVLNNVLEPAMLLSLASGLLSLALVFYLLRTITADSGDPDIVMAVLSTVPIAAAVVTILLVYSLLNKRKAG